MGRLCASVFATAALLTVLVLPANGEAIPRMPRDAADWATFSEPEGQAAIAYQWRLLQKSIADGTAVVHTVGAFPNRQPASDRMLGEAIAATGTYNCMVQWIDQPAGSWVRGGGWTDTSANVYRIYASRSGKQGEFRKDGVLKGNWWEDKAGGSGASHAESWTGYDYKWWYESFNYVVKGWHGAQETYGGNWIIGPDQYCYLSVYH